MSKVIFHGINFLLQTEGSLLGELSGYLPLDILCQLLFYAVLRLKTYKCMHVAKIAGAAGALSCRLIIMHIPTEGLNTGFEAFNVNLHGFTVCSAFYKV